MFRASADRLRAWLSFADDLLGDPTDLDHPHRRPARVELQRRGGTVPPAPAHCISPVRPTGQAKRQAAQPR